MKDAGIIRMVLNGHEMGRHVGYKKDQNKASKSVHQMMFNAQGLGGGSAEKGNGGDGWLRILTFEPDHGKVSVRTFSPLREKLGLSKWNKEEGHDFVLQV